jgi:hypothetical protein
MNNSTNVKLQNKIINEIDNIMKNRPDLFYRTRTDFICDAIRRHVRYILDGGKL